ARAVNYMQAYGATPRHFAMCAAKNRAHAARNPKAIQRSPISVAEILADRVVIPPLTRSMCGGVADGAASIVLASAAFAQRHGLRGPRLAASVAVSGISAGGRENATARAGAAAFAQAGLSPREVSLAEVHDPTAPQELLDIEDLGLCGRGEAVR